MFDFGFSELVVIGVVLLIVVGPERLPKVARTAGHLLGRLQRYVSDVKSDIQREMQLEELKKLQEQVKQQAQELESSVRTGVAGVENQLGGTVDELRSTLPDAASLKASTDSAAAPAAVSEKQLDLGLDAKPQASTADKTQA
ncbi:Sec-independent protein translocase protein TatB [Thauera sp.]|uniref:Sec-independent protein translocase protein TatB n=1 Tax=Thauera sp. TaxID=1905334 RepID=UPI0039E49723